MSLEDMKLSGRNKKIKMCLRILKNIGPTLREGFSTQSRDRIRAALKL